MAAFNHALHTETYTGLLQHNSHVCWHQTI